MLPLIRTLLVALAVITASAAPARAWTLIDSDCAAGPNTVTVSNVNTVTADLLVVTVTENTVAGGTLTATPSVTLSLVTGASIGTVSPGASIYYAIATATSGTHSVEYAGSSTFAVVCLSAWDGADTSAPLDLAAEASGAGFTNTAQPGAIVLAAGDRLVVSAFGWSTNITIASVTGMTLAQQIDFTGGTNYGGGWAHAVEPASGSFNPTWNFTGTVAGSVVQASFLPGAGGGGGPAVVPQLMLMGVQ